MATASLSLRIGRRSYAVVPPSVRDPRLHVAAVLLTVQALGQTVLGFRVSIAQILACIVAGALIEIAVTLARDGIIAWPASGMLTGNSTAFILRAPGTEHGEWWSLNGIWIFLAVVVISMASKYLIRWRGGHVFNPSNLGLVLAFTALGPRYTEPQDLWWIPFGPWLLVTYAILIAGGVLVGRELRLLGLETAFMLAFAAFAAIALIGVPDHCMVASWRLEPICGVDLWTILVTSPEILVFAFFMVPDPRTVPASQRARIVFGILVAFLSVLFLGPTTLEFWTKTGILASLVVACATRYALVRLVDGARVASPLRRTLSAVGLGLIGTALIPIAADIPTHMPQPAPGATDGSIPPLSLTVGSDAAPNSWLFDIGAAALPRASGEVPTSASARAWLLPAVPDARIAGNVKAFDPSISPERAAKMAYDAVRDLVIVSEARRTHDVALVQAAAVGEVQPAVVEAIQEDLRKGRSVRTSYTFDSAEITLWLAKFSSQNPRLIGITLRGSTTIVTEDATGLVIERETVPYLHTWGLGMAQSSDFLLVNDYTAQELAPAP